MLTHRQLQATLANHRLVQPRLQTLARAAEINLDFRTPHIQGGYLRNVALGSEPKDCDVFFAGSDFNQPGIIEAINQAQRELGLYFEDWEFENLTATGMTGDFLVNAVGQYSPYTDHISTMVMNPDGALYIGGPKTLHGIAHRIYDLRFEGIDVWAHHRGQGRSYTSCLVGDLIRAIYLCLGLDLTPSAATTDALVNFDRYFHHLDYDDQQYRLAYWLKKTSGHPKYRTMLDQYGVTSLPINPEADQSK